LARPAMSVGTLTLRSKRNREQPRASAAPHLAAHFRGLCCATRLGCARGVQRQTAPRTVNNLMSHHAAFTLRLVPINVICDTVLLVTGTLNGRFMKIRIPAWTYAAAGTAIILDGGADRARDGAKAVGDWRSTGDLVGQRLEPVQLAVHGRSLHLQSHHARSVALRPPAAHRAGIARRDAAAGGYRRGSRCGK
jgi:hypothetical protein